MIEAQVPDTVISALVSRADAVMEDWQPVNVDEAMKGREIYTESEVYNVYPGWGGYYGWPNYGWCGTPYYGGWYDPWYSGLYVGFGYGGWGFGFGFGGGYCGYGGYYDPWYGGGGYYGGGYCGYYDPYPGCGGYPYYGYNDGYSSYRVIDRPNYSNGADRGTQRGVSPTPYRQDPLAGSSSQLATLDGRTMSTLDRSSKTPNHGKQPNNVGGTAPASRSVDNLKQIPTQPVTKSTLKQADQGKGRYAIKGTDKQLRDGGEASGRNMETLGKKFANSGTLAKGSTPSDRSVKSEVARGLDRGQSERNLSPDSRVTETTRGMTNKAGAAAGTMTTGQKVDRYLQMKHAQRAAGTTTSGRSVGNRTNRATSGHYGASPSNSSGNNVGTAVRRQQGSKSTGSSPTVRSAPPRTGRSSSGGRATPSAGSAPRSGGGSPSFGGRSSGGGGGGARSGGGGGGSRGGGGGGSRGGGRGGR